MWLNSMQNACTSIKRSCGMAMRGQLTQPIPRDPHTWAISRTWTFMILLRMSDCRKTHTNRTCQAQHGVQACGLRPWGLHPCSGMRGGGALPRAGMSHAWGEAWAGRTNRFCMYLSLIFSHDDMQLEMYRCTNSVGRSTAVVSLFTTSME